MKLLQVVILNFMFLADISISQEAIVNYLQNVKSGPITAGVDIKGNLWFARHSDKKAPVLVTKFDKEGKLIFVDRKTEYPPEGCLSMLSQEKPPVYTVREIELIFDGDGNPLLFWPTFDEKNYRKNDIGCPEFDWLRFIGLSQEGAVQVDMTIPALWVLPPSIHYMVDSTGKIHILYGWSDIRGYLLIERHGNKMRVIKHCISPPTGSYSEIFGRKVLGEQFPDSYGALSFLPIDGKKAFVCGQPMQTVSAGNSCKVQKYIMSLQVHPVPSSEMWVWSGDSPPRSKVETWLKGPLVDEGNGLFEFSNIEVFEPRDYAFRKYENTVIPANELMRMEDGSFILTVRAKDEDGRWGVYQVRFRADGKLMKPGKMEKVKVRELRNESNVLQVKATTNTSVSESQEIRHSDGRISRISGVVVQKESSLMMFYGFDKDGNLYIRSPEK